MTRQATAGRLLAMVVTVVVLAWMAGAALAADTTGAPPADPEPSTETATVAGGPPAMPLRTPTPPTARTAAVATGGIVAEATTTEVLDNGDGTATVTILLSVANGGETEVSDVSLVDDVVQHLADLSPTGFVTLDGSLMANPRWDGTGATSAVADGQTLQPGQLGDVGISFTVEVGTSLADNQVLAVATDAAGQPVTAAATNVLQVGAQAG